MTLLDERQLRREMGLDCGPALALGLEHLTRTERRLFDVLYANRAAFTPSEALVDAVWPGWYDAQILRTNIARLRIKLRGHGWRIDTSKPVGAYRLIEDRSA